LWQFRSHRGSTVTQNWQTNLGDISTFVDSNGQTGLHFGKASDGLWAAYFGSTAADGAASISQTLATTAVNQDYTHYQVSFVASSSATQLQFSGSNDNSYFELDDVVVAAIPEPGTWGLRVTGAAAIGFVFRGSWWNRIAASPDMSGTNDPPQSFDRRA
jgi:hypothetical protein